MTATANEELKAFQSKKTEMNYLQKPEEPTWFKTERQAKEFMNDLERSTGVRHVIQYTDDDEGGCVVVPFFVRDKDGISIEADDVLYSKDGEQIQVVDIQRKDLESYEVLCATQNAESVNFSADALARYWRHSPWTQTEQAQAHREEQVENIKRKANKSVERKLSAFTKICDWSEERVLVGLMCGAMALFIALPIALPLGMSVQSEPKVAGKVSTVTIPCTVTDLTVADDQTTYETKIRYYVTLQDTKGEQLRFQCAPALYQELEREESVVIVKQEKAASALEKLIYSEAYTGTVSYTVNGYEISNPVIIK